MATDEFYANVSLLLHMEGTDEGTTFIDNSPIVHTVTASGDANTEADQKKFGSTSLQVGSTTSDFLTVADHASFQFGSGDFTIEMWVYPGDQTGRYILAYGTGATFNPWVIGLNSGSTLALRFWASSSGTSYDIANAVDVGTMTASVWNHVAICREGSTWNLYLNGTRTSTFSSGATITNVSRTMHIGGETAIGGINGYVDELRLTKGVARYSGASYTEPTEQFADSGPILPAEDVLVITGETPVGLATESHTALPGADALDISTFTPAIDKFLVLDLANQYLLATYAPGVADTLPRSPGAGAIAFAGEVPGLGRYLSIGSYDQLFLTGQVPLVAIPLALSPPAGAMSIAPQEIVPSVTTYGADVSFETLTGAAEGSGSLTQPDMFFAELTAQAVGLNGQVATGAPKFKPWTAAAFTVPGVKGSFKALTASGVAQGGRVGVGSTRFRALTAEGYSIVGQIAAGAPRFLPLRAAAAGTAANDAVGAPLLAQLQNLASGIGGNVATGAAAFKKLTMSGEAYGGTDAAGVASFTQLAMDAIAEEALTGALTTWAMNPRISAVSAYPSYPANSFARYNGTYLAAGPTGLFDMQGADSAGVEWTFKTGQLDEQSPRLKRVGSILMNLRYEKPVTVTVWKDEQTSYSYAMPTFRPDVLHQARVVPGKGMRSRQFQVELSGSGKFDMNALTVDLPQTSRRIG